MKQKLKIVKTRSGPDSADSMASAAGLLGISRKHVQFAKEKGCKAFRDSRVDLPVLKQWLEDNKELVESVPLHTKEEIDIKLKELKLERDRQSKEREKFQFDIERGKYWSKEEVSSEVRQIAAHRKAVLQRTLEMELPPKLLGLDVVGITEEMSKVVNEICAIFHDRTRKWQS